VPNQAFHILNLDIEQSECYEIDNHLVGNKYVAQHHSEVLAAMLEIENEENLSKFGCQILFIKISFNQMTVY